MLDTKFNKTTCEITGILPSQDQNDATQDTEHGLPPTVRPMSAFKSLGWLDRFLAVWILMAMGIGILIGNFASGVDEALKKGHFVGVSIPIGKLVFIFSLPALGFITKSY